MHGRGLRAALIVLTCVPALALSQPRRAPVAQQDAHTGTRPASSTSAGAPAVHAIRLQAPLRIDGRLDDEIYQQVVPAAGFVQQEPQAGRPASEPTDVWVFFDASNVYVSARCWDDHQDRIIANEMRRDGNVMQNDNLTITFDTFRDRRTAFYFQTNPLGALRDQLVDDEKNANLDWNTVWESKTSRDERGWSVEMVIPFKSLRYPTGVQQVWGINVRRIVRWKNETSFLAPIPPAFGSRGAFAIALSGTLDGLEAPESAAAFEMKPYAKASVLTDHRAPTPYVNDPAGAVGIDVKYGLTKGLVADLTVNTDFAQVEVDEQQVNLTRASLFFPEKRDFFLEGQGIFGFGGTQQSVPGASGLGPLLEVGSAPSLIPSLFFSRRIGLSNGREVPIREGGRVAGRAGAFSIGLLNIQTGASKLAGEPATNFSVVRLKRDILRRSNIGLIATSRSPRFRGPGSNQAFGGDATLSFFQNLVITSYYARTRTPGMSNDDRSYLTRLDWAADRVGLNVERLMVGEGFRPDIGLLRRTGFVRTYGYARFSPRPQSTLVRKSAFEVRVDHIDDRRGTLQTREVTGAMRLDMHNGDQLVTDYRRSYEFLDEPLRLASTAFVQPGQYAFQDVGVLYYVGPQRRLSGRFNVRRGSFYGGTKTEVGMTSRLDLGARLGVEPRLLVNWIDLPHQRFVTQLSGGRFTFTLSPRLAVSSLIQYSSDSRSLTTNVRFRWEYVPGSDLFVVYSDGRDTSGQRVPRLDARSFVVKATRLLRR